MPTQIRYKFICIHNAHIHGLIGPTSCSSSLSSSPFPCSLCLSVCLAFFLSPRVCPCRCLLFLSFSHFPFMLSLSHSLCGLPLPFFSLCLSFSSIFYFDLSFIIIMHFSFIGRFCISSLFASRFSLGISRILLIL